MKDLKIEIYADDINSNDPISDEDYTKGLLDIKETFLILLKAGVMPRKGESIWGKYFQDYLIITDIGYREGGKVISVYCDMQ